MAARSRIRYYLLFTIAFSAFWYLFKLGGIPDAGKALASTELDVALNIAALVLVVEWLLPRWFYRGRYMAFGWGLGLVVAAGGSLNILGQLALAGMSLFDYQTAMAKYHEHFYFWFWSDLVAGSYFMIAVILAGGIAIRLSFDRVLDSRRLARLEAEKLRSDLEALRNQINPHFIFNALNTLYYTIDPLNRNAREMTDRFASLLRYQLYECNADRVDIAKEIRFIEDYIALQRERTGDGVNVICKGLRELSGFTIPPHLLMPLVENCFKHVSRFADRPNFIEIFSEYQGGVFRFQTRNSYLPGENGNLPGLGLSLTRKRLDLLAGNKGQLITDPADDRFLTTLILELS
jgi:hypothetical protein